MDKKIRNTSRFRVIFDEISCKSVKIEKLANENKKLVIIQKKSKKY